jgi:hypothetical protein
MKWGVQLLYIRKWEEKFTTHFLDSECQMSTTAIVSERGDLRIRGMNVKSVNQHN